jgi:UMF1 family MFS transporter
VAVPQAVPARQKSVPRLLAWIAYDWAYAPFNTVVVTFVFATYFVRVVAPDPARGTADWAWAQAAAGLVVALLAAPMGALADRGAGRRSLLALGTIALAGCTAALWFIRPDHACATAALVLVAAATVAFELATTFYNAMLPDIAAPGRLGLVSSLAWGAGYLGGLAALLACLFGLIGPAVPPFGLDRAAAEPVRAAMPFAAAWLLVFSAPLLLLAGQGVRPPPRAGGYAAGLRRTLRLAAADKRVRKFLLARMLYGDGLTTLFAFGAIYAAGRFAMSTQQVLQLGIGLNVTAGLGALGFALVEDRLGSRRVVLAALCGLIVLGAAVLLAPNPAWFWATALPLGLFIGPAQSASRSFMAQLAPPAQCNAAFGLYALSGRVTGFVGPLALAAVTTATGSTRAGMAVVLLLLGAGALVLRGVPAERAAATPAPETAIAALPARN